MGPRGEALRPGVLSARAEGSPLARALGLLERETDIPRTAVGRVEVRGRRLVLTAATLERTRWLGAYDEPRPRLVELWPEQDPDLPVAAARPPGGRLVSYRPGRRLVLRLAGERIPSVLKAYRRGRAARAGSRYAAAAAAPGFRIPELLAFRSSTASIVLEEISGGPLGISVEQQDDWCRVGASLRAFQEASPRPDLAVFGPDDEVAGIDGWAEKVQWAAGDLPPGWLEARRRLGTARTSLPPNPLGLAHRDLHDRQLLRADADLALLDLDLLCCADPALDPANLAVHLRLRCLQGIEGVDPVAVAACVSAVLAGLSRCEEPGFEQRLAFYGASASLRLALVYRLRPRWAALPASLVEHACALLAGTATPVPTS